LARLAATGTVRVPEVLGVLAGATPALVLAHVAAGPPSGSAMADAGRRLAQMHARRGLAPGLARDNFIGSLPQDNGAVGDGRWLTFLRQRRLEPLSDGLPGRVRRRLEALDLEAVLDEPAGGCALLHGDLWGGNLLCGEDGAGWVIDPAVYAGHPEVDLAMTRLFGGFDGRFYAAYQEVAGPFDRELDARLAVLNLIPLLVHVRLFGGSYLGQVESTLARYG
jgi:fructosamine-3-kinase